ncbi:MAG: flagellar motor switch protein FliG [Gammaproteobacteria bacterium]|nr:flagellar motor switch protein FliG [Gammaproteobacteria bacterium]
MADEKEIVPEEQKLTGVERSAVLLLTLGTDDAAEVLKHMNPKEVQAVGSAMASMSNINQATVNRVMDDFMGEVGDQSSLGIGSEDYIRSMLVAALGEDKAGNMIDRILMGSGQSGLEALKWMDGRSVAEVIRLEHPQIIAIVLSYLDASQSAEVLALLPERQRPDILMRVAYLDGIAPAALQELDKIMERQFEGSSNVTQSSIGGMKTAANILNYMDGVTEAAITSTIAEADQDTAEKIHDLMFVFDNLVEVDDRGIQSLLREVSSESLVVALKGAEAAVKAKFLKNMSSRAAEMMEEDIEVRGPVRVSEVEAAQKEIIAIARRMADEGDIQLGGAEEFV